MATRLLEFETGETLYESGRTLVCRGRRLADGLPVVLKVLKPEASNPRELARARREFEILSELGLPSVVKAYGLEEHRRGLVMVQEDVGGRSLDRLARPLPLRQFLELAIKLAQALSGIHRQRIVHKDVSPANLVFNPATGQVRLIDFGLADEVPLLTVAPQPPGALEGTLEYISPEQTGRMNRAVDYRTDFYSLGATFYRLLTGRLPFEAEDALGLVHCHIAATPLPPHLVAPAVPPTVSRIVLKLMAKRAEERYQSGRGLEADLHRCLLQLQEEGEVGEFEPGLEDVPERLQVPQKLYGREEDARRLLAAFERARAGGRELLLVAGFAGVGKTALVHEVLKPVLEARGFFLQGKFDQLQRNVPYSGWIQALGEFVEHLLMESEAELARWKESLLAALGGMGGVLTEVIPKLGLIIGPQPPALGLGGAEAQNRFNYLFLELVRAIATRDRPLVIFLDDLQWIDPASLRLLQALIGGSGAANLLVLGAYRDNEVDELHPLMKTVEALRKDQAKIDQLTLASLPPQTVDELIAETLGCDAEKSRSLSRLIYSKTAGNPFFTLQVLKVLAEKGAITFDVERRGWSWDIAALRQMAISDNVVTLMLGKLGELAPEPRQMLPLAAAMGFRFNLSNLSVIARQGENAALEQLRPALREGLIVPFDGDFQFVHDRVQQAAYALIPEVDKRRVHLESGRLLLRCLPEDERDQQLFAIADHLNTGAELIEEPGERLELAQLNLQAGRRARDSAAFAAAAGYFASGIGLLPPDGWKRHYGLALALHKESAECEYLTGNHPAAEGRVAQALGHAASDLDRAGIFSIQVVMYTTQNRFEDAINAGLRALRLFGVDLPEPGDRAAMREAAAAALAEYRESIRGVDLAALAEAPPMTDPAAAACMDLLMHLSLVAYYANHDLLALLTTRMVALSSKHGNGDASALGYVLMAMVSVSALGDYPTARELSRVARELTDRRQDPALEAKALMFYANCADPWFHPVRDAIPQQRRGFRLAVESGSLNDGLNCLWGISRNMLFAAVPLDEALAECRNTLAFAVRIHDRAFQLAMLIPKHVILCFQGRLSNPGQLESAEFSEAAFMARMTELGFLTAIAHFNVFKAWTLVAYGRWAEAASILEESAKTVACIADQPHAALHYFHHALVLARECDRASPEVRTRHLAAIAEDQQKLARWAEHCPENFAPLQLAVAAELARVEGRGMEAVQLYDKAIEAAARSDAHYAEGLSCELAARFWLAKDKEDFAGLYLEKALQAYTRWQAWGKVKALAKEYPRVFAGKPENPSEPGAATLDLDTLMKATRVVSAEMELNRLLAALMEIVVENAGAQSGLLLLEKDGDFRISVRMEIGARQAQVGVPAVQDESELVAMGVVRYVARTKEWVVLDDAASRGEFVGEPHIRRQQARSLLCAPLLSRGRLVGVLYLENNLVPEAFSAERVQFLQMLLSQAAISLENARIYEALRESEAKYRRIVDTATEGIWVLGPDATTTFVNGQMAAMIGCSVEELIGRPMADFLFEEDKADHRRKMEVRRQGIAESYERRFRSRGGGEVWTLASATPIFDDQGRFAGSFAMYADITRRRQAEQERERLLAGVQAERSRLQAVLDTAPLGISLCLASGGPALFNKAAESILGLPPGNSELSPAAPGPSHEVRWPNGEPVAAQDLPFSRSLRGEAVTGVELLVRQRSGREVWILENSAPIRDSEGRVVGAVRAFLDISPLREQERLRDEFIASAAHELKTPVTTIQGYATLLRRWSPEERQRHEAHAIEVIGKQTHRIGRRVQEMLEVVRLRKPGMELPRERLDLGELAAQVVERRQSVAGEPRLALRRSGPVSVECDRERIEEVLERLLDNAASRSPQGAEVEVRAWAQSGEARLSVRDRGSAIAKQRQPHLFEPFYEPEPPGSPGYRGVVALDLYLSRLAIEGHRGRIWVESEEEEGTTVCFSLPLSQGGAGGS